MNRTLVFQRIIHLPRRIGRESVMVFQLVLVFLLNKFGRKPVIAEGGPVVSMTTYRKRSQSVFYAIETIAKGTIRPSRLILWIDDEELLNNLPESIRRLQKRGLDVRPSRNYGPHTKYYPFVESHESFETPLVTADDDVLYPRYWLEELVEANREYPEAVNCYWAHVIETDSKGIGKYASYKVCGSTDLSFRNLALGVMGVIYPPSFLMILKGAGTAFLDCCPTGDDLWLHVQALRAGYKVRQIRPKLPYYSFHEVPGAHQTALSFQNVTYGDGNDRQMKATYTEADIQLLRAN